MVRKETNMGVWKPIKVAGWSKKSDYAIPIGNRTLLLFTRKRVGTKAFISDCLLVDIITYKTESIPPFEDTVTHTFSWNSPEHLNCAKIII